MAFDIPLQLPLARLICLGGAAWAMLVSDAAAVDWHFRIGPSKVTLEALPAILSAERDRKARGADDFARLYVLWIHVHNMGAQYSDSGRDQIAELEELMRETAKALDLKTIERRALSADESHEAFLDLYCQRWIEREVEKLKKASKRQYQFPEAPPKFGEGDTMKGWWEYMFTTRGGDALRKAVTPFLNWMASAGVPAMTVLENKEEYAQLREKLLRGGNLKTARKWVQFSGWGGRCLTGMEAFWEEQTKLLAFTFLREGHVEEALGASLFMGDCPGWLREPGRPFDTWRRDFLVLCGIEWEEPLISLLRFDALASYGSEKALHYILGESGQTESRPFETGVLPLESAASMAGLAAFLPPGDRDRWSDEDPRTRLPESLQADILQRFTRWISNPDPEDGLTDYSDLQKCLSIVARLKRPELKPAVRSLLRHPDDRIAEKAVDILRAMDEDATPAPKSQVRVLLQINGQPWTDAEVECFVTAKGAISIAERRTTDSDGILEIPRRKIAGADQNALKVRFSRDANRSSEEEFTGRLREPLVSQEFEVAPSHFLETNRLNVTTCPLPVTLEPVPNPESAKYLHISLVRVEGADRERKVFDYSFYEKPVPARFQFDQVQPGKYRLVTSDASPTPLKTEPFEVSAGMEPVRVHWRK